MISIVQTAKHDEDPGGLRTYEVRINRVVITAFRHHRRNGLAECLRLAANAVEAQSARDTRNAIAALAADKPKEPINMPRGARRTCDDGYPSCRMAEATGEWCFDVCLGVRVKSTSKEDALAVGEPKEDR